MKKYLLPRAGKFYKANMHTHTSLTTGSLSPEEAKELYKSLGYSIAAFTNHEVVVPHTELRDEDFLPITAFEISIAEKPWSPFAKCYHFNIYMPKPDCTYSGVFCKACVKEPVLPLVTEEMEAHGMEKRSYSPEFANSVIRIANSEGCLVSYNHPVWSNQNYRDYASLRGLWAVEWYNHQAALLGNLDTLTPIDDLLREGERVYPIATDDTHGIASAGGGWICVKAKALDYDAVFDALRRGDFYSSTGPEIKSLYAEDGAVYIKTSGASRISLVSSSRIGKTLKADKKLLYGARFDLSKIISLADITREDKGVWFRIEVTDKHGNRAITRAYYPSECK